ncbi:hypothetical protein CY34DRAFT_809937, partial [Suillus luteus UH-Slu-Lm8-n1]
RLLVIPFVQASWETSDQPLTARGHPGLATKGPDSSARSVDDLHESGVWVPINLISRTDWEIFHRSFDIV